MPNNFNKLSSLDDISILKFTPNLQVLSLSVNRIHDISVLSNLPNLTELYLRKNEIDNINQLSFLSGLNKLKVLWFIENPCVEGLDAVTYRKMVLQWVPQLEKLDDLAVTKEEVQDAMGSLQSHRQSTHQNSYPSPTSDDEMMVNATKPSIETEADRKRPTWPKDPTNPTEIVESIRNASTPVISPSSPLPSDAHLKGLTPPMRLTSASAANIQTSLMSSLATRLESQSFAQQTSPTITTQNQQTSPGGPVWTTRQNNILIAVVSLLKELDDIGLRLVSSEMDQIMANRERESSRRRY